MKWYERKSAMTTIELARRMAELGEQEDACQAYHIAIQQNQGQDLDQDMEAAVYILRNGGDYKISYTCFRNLYNQGYHREDLLPLMTAVFYEPNIKLLSGRYERNCKLLAKYPYLFRKDFLPFEQLPIRFYPYDDYGFIPYDPAQDRFGDYVNFKHPVVSRNFFKDLDKPILASDVYSQYELEYLCDNVRDSEFVGRENHIYLHYSDWGTFCAHLQCINLRRILETEKIVFLIGDELSQYPIDFSARFGIDYSQFPIKPLGIREVNRLIWHTQLSTHNGGDFFNEVFDSHPNLLVMPSLMFDNITDQLEKIRASLEASQTLSDAFQNLGANCSHRIVEELYHMKDLTDKDLLVAIYFSDKRGAASLDPASRIAPALFFQPHFHNIVYSLGTKNSFAALYSKQYEQVCKSPLFRAFQYIKTFTPMRRPTTSHGATVKFMYQSALESVEKKEEKKSVVSDAISERILNRSFMIDWQDRLYKDSRLVRFEDGKLNPKATFTALAAFLDLPYTESMTYCSLWGKQDAESYEGNVRGFDPAAIYRTYDEYINDDERYFIEFFLRDAYEFYGYGFQYYDGAPMDETRAKELIGGFERMNHYIRETWRNIYMEAEVSQNGKRVDAETERTVQEKLLEANIEKFSKERLEHAKILLQGLNFVNRHGQPLHMMPKLELDPALLEQPLYH